MRYKVIVLALLLPTLASASTVTIPAAASVHGRLGTFFHSDVAILNTSTTQTASVTARYRCFGGGCGTSAVQTFTIAPRQVRFFPDIVSSLFLAPETGGAIELESEVAIVATSRLYTPSRPLPTVGQFVPGLSAREAFNSSRLTSLSHSADPAKGFRTNIGIYNPNDSSVGVAIWLYGIDETFLGYTERTIPAREPIQINDIFGTLGVTDDVPDAYCQIVSGSIDGPPIFTYASVVDNQSQDPIFVPGQESSSFRQVGMIILPAVASLHGRLGTFFHSDVSIYDPRGVFRATYRCFGGACGNAVQTVVSPPHGKTYDDIVATMFGAPETGGAIELEMLFPKVITSRLYTPSKPEPTVGQFVPARYPHHWHLASVVTSLAHSPDSSTGFRSNVGAFNPQDVPQTLTFEVRDETGVELGRFTRPLGPHEGVQVNNVFGEVGVTKEIRSGYCTVRGDGQHGIIAYGSVIDNLSQDPVFVPGMPDNGCEYVLSNYRPGFGGSGAAIDIAMEAPAGCTWNVTNATPWLTVSSGTSGSGSGTIRLMASSNPTTESRTGTLLIAGQKVDVHQLLGTLTGQWRGTSGLGSIAFSVAFNQTGTWTIAFTAQGSGCTIFGTVTQKGIASIRNGTMEEVRIGGSATGGTFQFRINGTFPTLSTASGTMAYELTSGSCTSTGTTNWTATKE